MAGCLALALAPPPGAAAAERPGGEVPGEAAALDRPLAGRPLAAVLGELRRAGLTLVFTSELVGPELVVLAEPPAGDPRAVLDAVLAPHGLEVEEGPGGVLVVVARPEAAAPAIAGRVVARGTRRGLAGAEVELRDVRSGDGEPSEAEPSEAGAAAPRTATTGADGDFSFRGLAPGVYALEARAAGYLPERLDRVAVAPGPPRGVVFALPPQPYVEEEIVVRPSRLSLGRALPESSFALSQDEIEELPHLGGDLFRALPLLPGVTGNDVSARFSVRGGRRDEVGVVLDGQELYEAFHLKDYDDALSIVPAAVLSGAELATGALAADRGDRMGGVLDLTTGTPPAERRTTLGLSVVDATAVSAGRFAAGRAGWLLSARRGGIDLAQEVIGDEDPRFWDLLAKVEVRGGGGDEGGERGGVAGRFLAAGDDLDFSFDDGEDRERLDTGYDSRYAWLTHDALLADDLWVATTASWASVRRDRGGTASEEEGSFALRDRRELEVRGVAQSWGWQPAPRHALSWGGELRRYDARYAYEKDLEPEFEIVAPFAPPRQAVTDFSGTLDGEHHAGWVSDRFGLGAFSVEAGLRFDRHTATDDELWSPRLAVGWQLGERSVARAAWGRFHQSQRPYELLVEDGDTALAGAERADHWVLGVESLLAANPLGLDAVRVEVYRRRIDDPRRTYVTLLEPLNFFPEIEPGRVRIDAERATAEGVEALLRGHLGRRFDWWLTYAYGRAEQRVGGAEVRRTFDQPHAASLVLHRRLPRGWDLTLAWRYHGGWPTTPVAGRLVEDDEGDEELVAVFGALNGARLRAYHRLDLRLARTWSAPSGEWTFYLDVQNLYDRENAAGFDVEIDDDEGVVRLIPESWPGIFPSLGVAWTF